MSQWVDTHCHLDAAEFDADRDAVHAASRVAGVRHIIIPAVETANFPAVRTCCKRYSGCLPAYGIHPLYVASATEVDLQTVRDWVRSEQPLAIGEIGLDFYTAAPDPIRQDYFLVEQLKLAREFDLPVLLHGRRAVDAVFKQVKRIGVRRGIVHAFNGSRQQAEAFLQLGFKLGFGGAMTYEGSRRIRELARTLPLEAMVLETDAPDLPPFWLKRGRNSPEELPRLAQVLAELRGLTIDDIAASTQLAVQAVFPDSVLADLIPLPDPP